MKKGIEYSIFLFFAISIIIAVIVFILRNIFNIETGFMNIWTKTLIAAVIGLFLGFTAVIVKNKPEK